MLWPPLLVLMSYTLWQTLKLYLGVFADVLQTLADGMASVAPVMPLEFGSLFMINMFTINDRHLSFCFLMSCPEPPNGISCVGSFPVWYDGPLIILPALLGIGSLALARETIKKLLTYLGSL